MKYEIILFKLLLSKDKMNVNTPTHKKLLGLEKWHNLFQDGNEDLIKNEMAGLQSAIEDIQKVLSY